jgi:hypothetical protein
LRPTAERALAARGFVEFFFAEMFPEPHSTKQVEDCVGLEADQGRSGWRWQGTAPMGTVMP